METLVTPSTEEFDAFDVQESDEDAHKKFRSFSAEDRIAARALRQEKLAHWATLGTRQNFVDERFMRSILSAAKLVSPTRFEPATVGRLRSMLRKIDIQGVETREAIGTSIEEFLVLNPNLPLWAAVALVLESTGKFDAKATVLADAEELLEKNLGK